MSDEQNAEQGPASVTEVTPEFIEENKRIQLGKTRQKSGGPYTKAERAKRRNEVYRLHFDLGFSATEIAEAMKVNRNTISDDLRLLYREVAAEAPDYELYLYRQMARLESQRKRVLSYLLHTESVDARLAVERLVADIDFRMLNVATKVEYSAAEFWNKVMDTYNQVAERKGLDYRVASLFQLMKVSISARKDLDSIYGKYGGSYWREVKNRKGNENGNGKGKEK
jgi:predicted DNA-binding protein YlxM (UPF0122 family)